MKNPTLKILSAIAVLSSPLISSVIAEEKEGFYTTLSAGVSSPKGDGVNKILPIITGIIDEEFGTETGTEFPIETDSGLKVEGGIGYDFGKARIEVTYDQSQTEMKSMDLSVLGFPGTDADIEGGERTAKSIMVSGFYDIDTNSKFTPYIGGGVGVSFIKTESWNFDDELIPPITFPSTEKELFSWQLQAGLAYDLNDKIDLTADITYKDTSDYNIGIMDVNPAALVSVEAGIRFYF